ncbi:hypothetical protein LMG3441_00797 [Achromobacter kerstersii]|uniref:Uncharacterized protein n=1 Tax=Achromobacter kerstersii TaxID=1353890 RepID=A0A6S6ZBH8_9BURK|nr:hypothetical protein LMG3441_00797 [Achromobacter kerstersii]
MKHFYSPRGAKRGLMLATAGALLWAVWAASYLHASSPLPQMAPSAVHAAHECECGRTDSI